jgi:hypothetical protein
MGSLPEFEALLCSEQPLDQPVQLLSADEPHPEQGLSRCLGIVRLARPVVILATGPRTAMPPKEIAHVGVP